MDGRVLVGIICNYSYDSYKKFVGFVLEFVYMKKDLLTHFTFFIAFFVFITIFHGWFSLEYIAFWFGGIIGTFLPDIDYLFYAYLLEPDNGFSVDLKGKIGNGKYSQGFKSMAESGIPRNQLIFHNASFNVLFAIFSFLVLSSSSSLLGAGLVLAFMLHLFLDMVMDYMDSKNIDLWFAKFPLQLDTKGKRRYMIINGLVLLAFGFLM
jgi:hypothetical protein